MTLKQHLQSAHNRADAIGGLGFADMRLDAAELSELLAALELAECVKWIEEQGAHLSWGTDGAQVTFDALRRGPDFDQWGESIPEAVRALQKKLETTPCDWASPGTVSPACPAVQPRRNSRRVRDGRG